MAGSINLPSLVTKVQADTLGFTGGMRKAITALGGFEAAAGAAGVAITAFIGYKGLKSAVSAFADFDAAMTQSTAIMGNLSNKTLVELRQSAVDVSLTTMKSAHDAAQAYFYLASAGYSAQQSIKLLPVVARFAQAGMFDFAQATELAGDAQHALGLYVKDPIQNMKNLTRVTDVLTKANTLANATVQQFSESLTNKVGARLRLLKKPMEEGVAALAALANEGVKGRRAGQGLNIVLRDLAKQAVVNAAGFQKFGLQVYDTHGNMRNIADIIRQVEYRLKGSSTAEATARLQLLKLNRRAQDYLNILIGTSGQIEDYEAKLKAAGGTTKEVADKQMNTLTSQMKLLHNEVTAVKIELGKMVTPAVMSEVKGLIGILDSVQSSMKGMRLREDLFKRMRELGITTDQFRRALKGTAFDIDGLTEREFTNFIEKAGGVDNLLKLINQRLKDGTTDAASFAQQWIILQQNMSFKPPEMPQMLTPKGQEEWKRAHKDQTDTRSAKQKEIDHQREVAARAANALQEAKIRLMVKEWNLSSITLDNERKKLQLLADQGAELDQLNTQADKLAKAEADRLKQLSQPFHLPGAVDTTKPVGHVDTLKNAQLAMTPAQIQSAMAAMTGNAVAGAVADNASSLEHLLKDPHPWAITVDAIKKGMVPALDELAGKLHLGTGLIANLADTILTALGSSLSKKGGFLGFLGTAAGAFAGGFASGGTIPAGQWGLVGEAGPEIVRGPATVQNGAPQPQPVMMHVQFNIRALDARGVDKIIRAHGAPAIAYTVRRLSRNSTQFSSEIVTGR